MINAYLKCEEAVLIRKTEEKERELGRELTDKEHYRLFMSITPEDVVEEWNRQKHGWERT